MEPQELPIFPHLNDDLATLIEMEPKPAPSKSKRDPVSFEDRFPQLSFRNAADQARFAYLGKHTQKHHHFYIRFDLKEKIDQPSQCQLSEVSQRLSHLATLKANDSPNIQNFTHKDYPKQQLFSIARYGLSQAYLLIGIAKPSTTANEIFDKLFWIQAGDRSSESDNESSSIEGSRMSNESGAEGRHTGASPLAGYHHIRSRWLSKLTSYEYFKFMTRIYLELNRQGLDSGDIAKELFYNTPPASIDLRNKQTQITSCISDQEYYFFFQTLFAHHSTEIQQQIAAFEAMPANRDKRVIELTLCGQKFPLYKTNYKQQVKSMFKGVELPSESVEIMAEHYAEKHRKIVEEFKFTTKKQRFKLLQDLRGEGDAVLPRVELVELVPRNNHEHNQEPVNMLVVVTPPSPFDGNAPEVVNLQEVIANSKPNELATNEAGREFLLLKAELFTYILAIKNSKSAGATRISSLVNHISFNPRNLLYNIESKRCFPDLDHCLKQALKLDKLPLTDEQAMLSMTPSPYVDIYQTLQSIIDDLTRSLQSHRYSLEKGKDCFSEYTERYCRLLSNERLTFRYLKQIVVAKAKELGLEQMGNDYDKAQEDLDYHFNAIKTMTQMQQVNNFINLNQKQYEQYLKICYRYISAKEVWRLLLVSMMEYEVVTQQKCILSCDPKPIQAMHSANLNQGSKIMAETPRRQLLRLSQLQQKEAYQMGMLMLISCRAVKLIECQQLKAKKIDLNIPSNLENEVCESFNNLERIKKVIEEHFLNNYKLYFRYLYQNNLNKHLEQSMSQNWRDMFLEENSFKDMIKLYKSVNQSLESVYQRSLMKVGFLLQLYDHYLSTVIKIIEIPQQLKRMLLVKQTSTNSPANQEGAGLVRDYLKQTFNKNTVSYLESQDYKVIKLDQDKKKPAILKIFTEVQRIRREVEDRFNPIKRQEKNNGFQQLIDSIQKLRDGSNANSRQLKTVLLQEEDKLDEPLKQKVIRKRFQIRKAKVRLFCEVYESRRQVREFKARIGNRDEVQKEDQLTIDILLFFLIQNSLLNKALLNVPRSVEVSNLLIQCSKVMITEILDLQRESP